MHEMMLKMILTVSDYDDDNDDSGVHDSKLFLRDLTVGQCLNSYRKKDCSLLHYPPCK